MVPAMMDDGVVTGRRHTCNLVGAKLTATTSKAAAAAAAAMRSFSYDNLPQPAVEVWRLRPDPSARRLPVRPPQLQDSWID